MNRRALLLLAAVLLCGVAIGPSFRGAPRASLLHDLERARPERAFAPRLSVATPYRRCTQRPAPGDGTVPREACGSPGDAPFDVDALAAAGESSDPDSLEASALAEVIWWDETEPSLNDALSRLVKALRLTRRPVPLLVDLSGAHLVRAQETQNPRDLVEGLNYAREALAREPRNQAALFNAALALQSLAIDEQAAKAWDAYLAADPASHWAEEARRRKRALPQPGPAPREPAPGASAAEVDSFAARYPQETRLLGWDHVLGAWGAARERGDARAASLLDLAEKLGRALERGGGDASLSDAVRAIRGAGSDAAATRTLARAHRAYAAGQALFRNADHAAAGDSFTRVVDARPPSPVLLQWATGFRGGSLVYLRKYAEADSVFRTLLARVDTTRHPAISARVRWMWGTRLLRAGRYPEAHEQYRSAARGFERLRETEFMEAVRAYDGETAYEQGDTIAGYRSMHRALLTLRRYRGSAWLHNVLLELAHCAMVDGMPSAAAPIQDEDVVEALRSDLPHLALEALLTRAQVRAMGGDTGRAAQDLDAAAPLVGTLGIGSTRDWFAATLRFSRSIVQARTNTSRSDAAMDSAIAYFSGNVIWLLPALMRRADTRLAVGDVAGATADLDTATSRIRGLSRKQSDASLRAAMVEQARSRFDQLVMLHLRAGRTDDALQALERGRASFAPTGDAGVPAGHGRPVAPRGQVALEYALIGDTLLIWTIRDTSVHLVRRTVDRGELVHAVERVGAALETPERAASARPDLRRLYDWLVRPVSGRLGAPETPLVILADGEVAGVPFAALLDARQARYLVEDHPLRFASTLADAARPVPRGHAFPGLALLVANPTFDALRHPTLDQLGEAQTEVDSLRALYPGSMLLEGRGATRGALTAWAQRASVIHYAGHAVFDDARPERSFLVLAGDGGSGQLTAEALNSLKLGGVRLVVLSACRTLRSRDGRAGGFAGLSGALLAAGAGGVVGSTWKVEDGLTQPLMIAFHREYLRSGDAAGALRKAQLHLLSSPDSTLRSPAAWAGFRYAGN